MTEADARVPAARLARCRRSRGLDRQPEMEAAPSDWIVTDELLGWQFRVDVVAAGLRITASAPGGSDPAV